MIIWTNPSFASPPAASLSAGHFVPDRHGKPQGTMLESSWHQVLTMWYGPFRPSLIWIMPPSKLHCPGLLVFYTPFEELHVLSSPSKRLFFTTASHLISRMLPPHAPVPYLSAESVVAGLEKLKAIITIREIACIHSISIRHDRLLEQYLQQAVMDSPPLPNWMKQPRLRQLVESYRHGDTYHLPIHIGSYCALPHPQEPEGSSGCSAAFHR